MIAYQSQLQPPYSHATFANMPKKTNQSHKKNWGVQVAHGVARKKDLGNTNTPMDVARAIVDKFLGEEITLQASQPGRWLEPAVGAGNFYLAVLESAQRCGIDPYVMAKNFDAVDIDPQAIEVLKGRLREIYGWSHEQVSALPIFCASLVEWEGAGQYQVVLTNPPYLTPKNWSSDPATRRAMLSQWQEKVPGLDPRSDLFLYFFRWCHEHLQPGGVSVFLCSDGWLDSEYGRALRDDFRGNGLTLEKVYAWPWVSLFRDDTCPIVTVVRKTQTLEKKGKTSLIIDDGTPLRDDNLPIYKTSRSVSPDSVLLSKDQLATWLDEGNVNRRTLIVTGPRLYSRMEGALREHAHALTPMGDIAKITGFSWSMNDIDRAGLLVAQPGATGHRGQDQQPPPVKEVWDRSLPLFFQKQARVGKPVDYRQARTTCMLGCRVDLGDDELSNKIRRLGQRTGGAWVSMAVDRFPLAFFQDEEAPTPWVGVSKYTHAQIVAGSTTDGASVSENQQGALLCALITSTLSILALERYFKEGTRKTLRRNENGYAKEITKASLANLPIPDWRKWDSKTLRKIIELQKNRSKHNLHRLDEAIKNEDWLRLDDAIGAACGVPTKNMVQLRALIITLYWRRMRNLIEYDSAAALAGL